MSLEDGRWAGLFTILLILLVSMGIASAAVSGTFTASYDGYEDGSSTDVKGHEIAVKGELTFSGESAVNPRIVVTDARHTTLDTGSIKVFVEGDQSIQFNRQYGPSKVTLTAEEIPAGTTIRLQYVVYPVGGDEAKQLTTSNVKVTYDRPGGGQEQKTFSPTASLENTPGQVIQSLKKGDKLSQLQKYLSYVGGLAIIILVLLGALKLIGGDGEGGGGRDVA